MASPIRVAILDEQLPAQLHERPDDAEGLEVVWSGTDLEQLLHFTARESPTVIVADLDRLGDEPLAAIERVLASSSAELVVTMYKFAPRLVVQQLTGPRRRVMKAPVNVPVLKTQMLSTIVRGLLSDKTPTTPPPARRRWAQQPYDTVPEQPPRFTDTQLGTLRERTSSIACECPNHVAEIVSTLVAFERYSRACASRNDEDAQMHRALASATSRARTTMEEVLTDLLRFEKIEV